MIYSICIGLTIAFCTGVLIIQSSLEAFLYLVEPSSDIELIEGDTVTLEYKLLINIFPNSFLKNGKVVPLIDKMSKKEKGQMIRLKITNVSVDDVGVYCLEVAGRRSSLTNLVIRRSFIEEPPRDIQLVEGQTVELKYKLLNDKLSGTFLKNDLFLPALKNIEKFVEGVWKKLKITNITQKDVGMYCLEVAGHRSRLTKVIIKRMKLIFRVFTYLFYPQIQPNTHAHTHTHTPMFINAYQCLELS
ncbi:titin-like [Mytilus trossulus]|uniref:titin-like n=1 Tax=Mytilus trossulus TaxID=6551 RepID=UPI0030061AB2